MEALKKLKGISSVPEVALFLLAGGEGRAESARYYRAGGTYSSLYNSQSILYSTNQVPISLPPRPAVLHTSSLRLAILPSLENRGGYQSPGVAFLSRSFLPPRRGQIRATVSTISHRPLCAALVAWQYSAYPRLPRGNTREATVELGRRRRA